MEEYPIIFKELADKFGTTVEHLWSVMIYQAPIAATTSLFMCLFWLGLGFGLFKFLYFLTISKKIDESERGILWAIFVCFSILSFIMIGEEFTKIIPAYLNPEYWALMQLTK